ncbi:hypothetical protein VQH23_08370 [Pararoseomonas sp. SCSIO 73927]|uniref:hypothetical protein n=1 Tax=Pararoseomonas sp. SCSIO 73927 TaxID=3114537 RepID=UPI0030CEDC5C
MAEPAFSDEELMAFADGELDGARTAAIGAAAGADPALAARIEAHRTSREAVRRAFAGVLEATPPPGLVRALEVPPSAAVLPFPARGRSGRFAVTALAASVAGLALVGGYLSGQRATPSAGLLAAGPALVAALRELPSGEAAGDVRVTASYAVPDGACRSFELSPEPSSGIGTRGLACNRGAGWRVELAVAHSGGISLANDRAGAAVDAVLDALGAGPAMSAEQEAALRARGWATSP